MTQRYQIVLIAFLSNNVAAELNYCQVYHMYLCLSKQFHLAELPDHFSLSHNCRSLRYTRYCTDSKMIEKKQHDTQLRSLLSTVSIKEQGMETADVVVIGAGANGTSTAFHL